ncbi:hypothetical protein BGZ65_007983 [Modicella reniformis]|uniref:Uncharacterized protein n=1 Tax=Modicella reniformis TaxID=1440133 RepID=A0A9P6IIL3_9FUNG|nr:hypothetical protein BGZ65_007983 [Modicella reniformis]
MVAANTLGKMTPLQLKRMLERYFVSIPLSTFVSVWKKTVEIGQAYMAPSEQPQVAASVESDAQGTEENTIDLSQEAWDKRLKEIMDATENQHQPNDSAAGDILHGKGKVTVRGGQRRLNNIFRRQGVLHVQRKGHIREWRIQWRPLTEGASLVTAGQLNNVS